MKLPWLHLTRCFTGRRWINIGRGLFAVGFGPRYFIERVWFGRRLVYARTALRGRLPT